MSILHTEGLEALCLKRCHGLPKYHGMLQGYMIGRTYTLQHTASLKDGMIYGFYA